MSILTRPARYETFHDAYTDILRLVLDDHQYANAPRGNASLELLGASFTLTDPRARTPYYAARRVNPVYNVAEVLWYLAGRQDLGMISHYAPRRRSGTPYGLPVDEGAYGSRIFRAGPDGTPSVFDQVLTLLRTQADGKRAVLPVFAAGDLADPDNPSVPCLLALHLLLREDRLHMVVYMRANDTDRGLLADVHSFTFIQEFAARLLGAQLGTYTHHVGSLHVAQADLPRVRRVLAEAQAGRHPGFAALSMPKDTGWGEIETLLRVEAQLRENTARYGPADIADLGLAPYWQQAVLLLDAYRQIVHQPGTLVDDGVLGALEPGYRWLLHHRWPARVPEPGTAG